MKTKRKFILQLFITVLLLFFCQAKAQSKVRVSYIGNCSFLYEAGGKHVLVDPFGTEFGSYFHLPSVELQQKIVDGEAPFDQIDVLLTTHVHGDHFNAGLTEAFLLNHEMTTMICPPQVYQQMADSCSNFEQIKARILCPELKIGESENLLVNEIPVQVIRMQHGAMRSLENVDPGDYTDYEKTEDYGYVVTLGSQRILHQGDGCLKINDKALSKIDSKIHIGHLSYFDWDYISYDLLKDRMHADTVIFMHGTIPAKEMEREELKKILPELVVFKKEMETVPFDE